MKKIVLSILAAQLIFVTFGFEAKAQTKLYEFVFDSSYTATVGTGTFAPTSGVSFTTDRFGNANKAINIANSGTSATLTGLPYSNSQRSISLWVKINVFNPSFNFLYVYGTSASPEGAFIKPNEARNFIPNHTAPTTHNTTGTWVHYVFTYDGTASRIYVNGSLVGTLNVGKSTVNNANLFRLGLTETGGQNFFNGTIDDLQIYSGALSASQVTDLFNACNLVNTTPSANLNICGGTSTTLSVSGSNISWYDVPTGGTALGTGANFTTPVLTSLDTFYAQTGTCSIRLAIAVNIAPSPILSPPVVNTDTSIVYCEGSQLELAVTNSIGVFRWFATATGGNPISTGTTFLTPALQNNAIQGQIGTVAYYVEQFNACSNPSSSARTPVTIKVGSRPFNLTNTTPAGNYFACTGTSATFSITTNADSVQWLSGNTIVGNGNVFTTPTLQSNVTYSVKVFNTTGCKAVIPYPVKVYVKEINGPTNLTTIGSAVCPGDTITLKAVSPTGAPLQWVIQNGPVIGIGDSIRLPAATSGTVYLVRSGTTTGCYSATTIVPVTISPTPTATISLSGTSISSTNLFDSYILLRDGTQVAQSTTTGTFTFSNATCGEYVALFTNAVNSCSPSVTLSMRRQNVSTGCDNIIIGIPASSGVVFPATVQARKGGGTFTAPITLNPIGNTNLNNICTVVGGTTNLEVRVVSANGCTYLFNQNITSVTTSSTPTLKLFGYVEGDLLTSCTLRSNVVTIAADAPIISFFSQNLTRCQGQTASLQAIGTGTLRWYNQPTGGSVLGTGANFTTPNLSSTSTFYVEAFFAGCTSSRTPVTVTVTPSPVATITQSGDTLFANTTGTVIDWFLNGSSVTSSLGNGPFIVPTQSGSYTVSVSASGCFGTSPAFAFIISGLTNDEPELNEVKVYPNPFIGELKLSLPQGVRFSLMNLLGKEVLNGTLEAGEQTIDTESLKPGSYILRLSTERSTKSITLIK